MRLSPFRPRQQWGCNTKNQLLTWCSCHHSIWDSGGNVTPKINFYWMQLSPFHPGRWWGCNTKNQFVLGAGGPFCQGWQWKCDTQKSTVDSVQLLPFRPRWPWGYDTKNQFVLGAGVAILSRCNTQNCVSHPHRCLRRNGDLNIELQIELDRVPNELIAACPRVQYGTVDCVR